MPETRDQFSHIVKEAERRYWPYPLVLVDDQPALAGDVNVYRLSRIIREQLGEG